MPRRTPADIAAADARDGQLRAALLDHLATAEPSADALAVARHVPEAVWPSEVWGLACLLDFYLIHRTGVERE